MSQSRAVLLVVVLGMAVVLPAQSQKGGRRPLAAADVDAITQLVMLEDTRQFDEAALTKLLTSAHPEVRRRAVVATGGASTRRGRPCSRLRARTTMSISSRRWRFPPGS